MREEKSGIRYFGFEELANAYNIKPHKKRTSDNKKLEKQREKFLSRHICESCHQSMTYIGDNIMVCKNPDCKGIKKESINEDGTKKITYLPSFHLLDDKGEDIANNIFD